MFVMQITHHDHDIDGGELFRTKFRLKSPSDMLVFNPALKYPCCNIRTQRFAEGAL